VQIGHLGIDGFLLTDEIVVALGCPLLSINLPGAGSRLLLLLLRLLLMGRGSYYRPHHDRRDGLESWSVLRGWRGDDGISRGYHIAPLGVGGSRAPPVPEAASSSLKDSPRVVHGEGGPPWTIPTNMVLESHSQGERLRWPRRWMVNSRLLKWMVLSRASPTPVGLRPLAMKESFGEGTIGMSKGKACYNSTFLACQLSIFSATTRYRVVKIVRSCSEMVM
jgi:hypothetical protein